MRQVGTIKVSSHGNCGQYYKIKGILEEKISFKFVLVGGCLYEVDEFPEFTPSGNGYEVEFSAYEFKEKENEPIGPLPWPGDPFTAIPPMNVPDGGKEYYESFKIFELRWAI